MALTGFSKGWKVDTAAELISGQTRIKSLLIYGAAAASTIRADGASGTIILVHTPSATAADEFFAGSDVEVNDLHITPGAGVSVVVFLA